MVCWITDCRVEVGLLLALTAGACLLVVVLVAKYHRHRALNGCRQGVHPLTVRRPAIRGHWDECECGKRFRLTCFD